MRRDGCLVNRIPLLAVLSSLLNVFFRYFYYFLMAVLFHLFSRADFNIGDTCFRSPVDTSLLARSLLLQAIRSLFTVAEQRKVLILFASFF